MAKLKRPLQIAYSSQDGTHKAISGELTPQTREDPLESVGIGIEHLPWSEDAPIIQFNPEVKPE